MFNTKIYHVWHNMKDRCSNKNHSSYHSYGGRGITVCNEWQDYHSFLIWATNNGWEDGLQIDREENNGNYEPSNCRFVTQAINIRNSNHAKLSMDMADDIRSAYANKEFKLTHRSIALAYGVEKKQITNVLANKAWI